MKYEVKKKDYIKITSKMKTKYAKRSQNVLKNQTRRKIKARISLLCFLNMQSVSQALGMKLGKHQCFLVKTLE